MLAIGRGLMANPRLLMLDEPSLGLAPALVDSIFDVLVELNRQGTTLLLVEQNANVALSIANRGYVMEVGAIVNTERLLTCWMTSRFDKPISATRRMRP